MSQFEIIQKKIEKKLQEIAALEGKLSSAKVYLQALNDISSALEQEDWSGSGTDSSLRKGSLADRAREIILGVGEPLHIDDLLSAMGKEVTRENKASLSGSLAAYVRKGEIFSRPAPNTYSLIELDATSVEKSNSEPPEGFGSGTYLDDEIPF